ncbi:metallophosphoesterase family protein [Cellulosimicrobium marinum]|uniref:metallophosphoesterase family protein n=1 Tax=Cellulosimicrobium marinum TaxID=1638992 RepID=UPI001E441AF4|nr:metallophosphoesterase family protein [Cellulosimicrobium marinum]MCB7135435.1 metallophosphatase family protein [Cellulosimicrobium marinum]
MTVERLAILSDVHGNLSALDAVLADAAGRGVTQVLNLGDMVGKGPRGSAVVDRCRAACSVNVRGNWEDFLPGVADDGLPEHVWWRDELRPDQRDWARTLPLSHDLLVSGRRLRLLHATAASLHAKLFRRHTPHEAAAMFDPTDLTGPGPTPDLVGYGDTHDAYVETDAGRTLFNVGSVGNPLDEPTPVYAVVEGVLGSPERAPLALQLVRVPYDVEAEIAVAHALGMPRADAWERELRTAVWRGHAT